MEFKIKIDNDVNEEEWDQNLLKNHASTLYQSYNWSKVYKSAYNSTPIFITISNDNDKVVGQLLTFIHNRYYWMKANPVIRKIGENLKFGSILFWWYGPVIHDYDHKDEIISKILDSLEKIASKNNVLMIRGSYAPLAESLSNEIFEKKGYSYEQWGTYIIDLTQNSKDIYENLNKKIRYDVRKSEKNQLEFEIGEKRSSLDEYAKLKEDFKKRVAERTGKLPIFYDVHWEKLQKKGYEKLFLARKNNEAVGGILGLVFNGTIIQHGVVNENLNTIPVGSFLTWNAIKWSSDMKYLRYDVGGFNPHPRTEKEKSIDFYKSKWGGRKVLYPIFTKITKKTKFRISKAMINPKNITKLVDVLDKN